MKNIIKTLLKMGIVGLVFFTAAPIAPVLIGGFLALKAVDLLTSVGEMIGKRVRDARLKADADTVARNKALHRVNTRKRSFDVINNQWDLQSFPLDMYPSRSVGEREAFFTCAGVENVVKGRFLGENLFGRQNLEFSMVIADARRAEGMANYIAENGLVGTTVSRTEDGRFDIKSDNAVDINTIVKEFYPPVTMKIEREIMTTKQYRISGCKSYEEALEKFKADRFAYRPESVCVTYQDTVDGVKDHPAACGPRYEPEALPAGDFIIDETTSEVYSKNVTFNAPVDCTPEAMRSIASDMVGIPGSSAAQSPFNRVDDLVEDACSVEPVLSDGLGNRRVTRYVEYGDNIIWLSRDRSTPIEEGMNIILRFGSVAELEAALRGDIHIAGTNVLVDRVVPDAVGGEVVVALPADRALLEALQVPGVADISERYHNAGLTLSQALAACVEGEIREKGYATGRLLQEPDFTRAVVNGVPLSQYLERRDAMVESGVSEDLKSREQQDSWLRDAAKIKAIHVELDMKNEKLVITSTVGTENHFDTVHEERKLQPEELRYMAARGPVSAAESRDLLMKMHPDYFDTYRVKGTVDKGMYADPVGDFVNGRRPSHSEEYKAARSEEKKAAVSKGNGKKNEPTPQKKEARANKAAKETTLHR